MKTEVYPKILKAIILTIALLFICGLIGFVFQYLNTEDKDNIVLEYRNLNFYINGEEVYNVFSVKYIVFSITVFSLVLYKLFRNEKNSSNNPM